MPTWILASGSAAQAQAPPALLPDTQSAAQPFVHLPAIGGVAEDRLRIAQILGADSTSGFLLRSTSTLIPLEEIDLTEPIWNPLKPQLRVVYNSAIPYSLNEGALWAGRGRNVEVTAGFIIRSRRFQAVLMPHFLAHQNSDFQTLPYPVSYEPARNSFASPWYPAGESIDRPSRFGDDPFYGVSLGQSSLTFDFGSIAAGAATENLWWGPGIRNALVMSNNAPGIPHFFLRTDRPLRTFVGSLEARWMIGTLSQSRYFDIGSGTTRRSISALALTLQPSFEPNLTLGAARAVYAPTRRSLDWPFDLFNVFRDVGRPAATLAAIQAAPSVGDDEPYPVLGPDQIFSLFGRWVFPEAGFEAYGEWGRTERPSGLRDALVSPNHTQGWTVGLQWAEQVGQNALFRLQTEASTLELSSTYRQRPTLSWYTSASVPQGYTNRGRVIGAAIGPGSSSQWLAGDFLGSGWQVGAFAGRVRWDNGAYYRRAPLLSHHGHDVSVYGGLRGGLVIGPFGISAELQTATRFNYLFQHIPYTSSDIFSVDIRNNTLRISVSAAEDLR